MIRFQMPASSAAGATHQTLIRTPTGNLHTVNIQPQQPHTPAAPAAATTVIRTSTPSVSQPLSVSTTQANAQAAAVPNTQMSPSTAKKKCKKFLSTLIKLANDQPEEVSANVKRLIQGLIVSCIILAHFISYIVPPFSLLFARTEQLFPKTLPPICRENFAHQINHVWYPSLRKAFLIFATR